MVKSREQVLKDYNDKRSRRRKQVTIASKAVKNFLSRPINGIVLDQGYEGGIGEFPIWDGAYSVEVLYKLKPLKEESKKLVESYQAKVEHDFLKKIQEVKEPEEEKEKEEENEQEEEEQPEEKEEEPKIVNEESPSLSRGYDEPPSREFSPKTEKNSNNSDLAFLEEEREKIEEKDPSKDEEIDYKQDMNTQVEVPNSPRGSPLTVKPTFLEEQFEREQKMGRDKQEEEEIKPRKKRMWDYESDDEYEDYMRYRAYQKKAKQRIQQRRYDYSSDEEEYEPLSRPREFLRVENAPRKPRIERDRFGITRENNSFRQLSTPNRFNLGGQKSSKFTFI